MGVVSNMEHCTWIFLRLSTSQGWYIACMSNFNARSAVRVVTCGDSAPKPGVKRTLRQAQREIFAFLGKNTYLIGHAISNDLRALRIAHDKIIDTTMLYPDYRGCPFSVSER